MKLHELKEGKIYIGEDDIEYKILDNRLCYLDGIGVIVEARVSTLIQNFTPKKTKIKKVIKVEAWANCYASGAIALHERKDIADAVAGSGILACIKLTGEAEIEVEE